MVHKKSEYILQFHRLSNDIRTQIWRENVLFRQKLKLMNLSDHYWRYQLIDDACECEDRGDIALMDTDLKRATDEVTSPKIVGSTSSIFHDKGVQTSDGGREDHVEYSLTEEKANENHNSSLRTEPKSAQEGTASKTEKTSPNVKTTLDHKISTKESHQNILNISSNLQTSMNPNKGFGHTYLNPSPTRNALRSYKSESKATPVFAPFGWNDSDKNVGDQKTFNVRAPIDQVHQSALVASGKRFLEIESYMVEQGRKRKQHNSHLSLGPINASSIWMTEYQASFCQGQRVPHAKRSLTRPIVWRYS